MNRMWIAAAALVLVAACRSGQPQDGSSAFVDTKESSSTALGTCAHPIPISAFSESGGTAAEFAYLGGRYQGYTNASRSSRNCSGKAVDQVHFKTKEGKKMTLYFDKSGWAGKN